jgi:hypothetical protein
LAQRGECGAINAGFWSSDSRIGSRVMVALFGQSFGRNPSLIQAIFNVLVSDL